MLHSRFLLRVLPAMMAAGIIFVAGLWARPRVSALIEEFYRRTSPRTRMIPKPGRVLTNGTILTPPVPRFEPGVVVAGGRVYMFSGFLNRELLLTPRCDVFDPETASWSRIPDMPVAVTHAGAAVLGDEIWVAGGFAGHHPGPPTSSVWRYHIPSSRWMTGPMLPEARGSGGLANVNGKLHFFGGVKSDRRTDSADHWVLSPGPEGKWEAGAPLLDAKNHFGTVVREGLVHLIGGQHGHDGTPVDIDDHQVYDAVADRWRKAARLPRARSHTELGSFVRDGLIVVAGGRSNEIVALHDVAAYDAATDSWQTLPGLQEAMRAPVVVALGPSLFAGLGGVPPNGVEPASMWRKYPIEALDLPAVSLKR